MRALKGRIFLRGLGAIDRRTNAARDLIKWKSDLIVSLGGDDAVTPAQRALAEDAASTKAIRDHYDVIILGQRTLRKAKVMRGLVAERMAVAAHLAKVLDQLGTGKRKPAGDDDGYRLPFGGA